MRACGLWGSDMRRDLTCSQRGILNLAAKGLCAKGIARETGKTVETIKSQKKDILVRLQAANMVNAIAIASRQGLLDGVDLGESA